MEYGGEIIRRTIADVRERQGSSEGIYFFALRNEMVIDATHAGGIARFINHCCRCVGRVECLYETALLASMDDGSILPQLWFQA